MNMTSVNVKYYKTLGYNCKYGDKIMIDVRDKSRQKCLELTLSNKKELFDNWDGIDYYDNEYIRENFNLDKSDGYFPTIDHKISVIYGFLYNIPADIIGDILNLCITKRCINSSKSHKTEDQYKNKTT